MEKFPYFPVFLLTVVPLDYLIADQEMKGEHRQRAVTAKEQPAGMFASKKVCELQHCQNSQRRRNYWDDWFLRRKFFL